MENTTAATIEDTIAILTDLLADAERQVEQEEPYRGSSYDFAVGERDRIARALAGAKTARH